MKNARLIVAGIGPGSTEDITPAVIRAIQQCDVVIGYKYYFRFIQSYLNENTLCIDTGMRSEKERAREAFEQVEQGKNVCVISSGDAGIYGMAPLIFEMKRSGKVRLKLWFCRVLVPSKAAALLGAPIGHDLCIISLSDLMTP